MAQQRRKGIWEGLGWREGPRRGQVLPLSPSKTSTPLGGGEGGGSQEKNTLILFILPLPGRHEEF